MSVEDSTMPDTPPGPPAARPAPAGFGRLASAPHPVLVDLLYAPALEHDLAHSLPHFLNIDAAHVVMLAKARLLSLDAAAQLLSFNRDLFDRARGGERVIPHGDHHRGLYLALEDQFVARLGAEVGGAAHLARSRNDLNATATRMRLRTELCSLLDTGDDLAATMHAVARRHL